jgi:hypothetical protein
VCCLCRTWLSAEQSTAFVNILLEDKQQKDEEIGMITSDDWFFIEDSITVIIDRHWDWWERKLELWKRITHTKSVVGNPEWKSQRGISRIGWRTKERQYEYLDLRVTNLIVLRQKIAWFCSVTSSPTAQSNKFFSSVICKICLIYMNSLRYHFCHVARCCFYTWLM